MYEVDVDRMIVSKSEHSLQITDLCEVSIPENLQPSAATTNGNASVTDGCGKGAKVEAAAAAAAASASLTQTAATSSKSNNELICLDESDVGGVGNKLDGFSLDDINDDDFNPRATSEDSEEDEEARSPPPQSAPPQALSPPLPPPALPPRVASNNSQNSSNLTSTPTFTKQAADNIFSSNPFGGVGDGSGGVDPFGMSAFQSPASGAHKGDKSPFAPSSAAAAVGQNFFDDLDPLRK